MPDLTLWHTDCCIINVLDYNMNYFILNNGQQEGPYAPHELLQHGLKSEALVWTEGMADWEPAWKVEELRPLLRQQANGGTATPPPIPNSNTQQGSHPGSIPPEYTTEAGVDGLQSEDAQPFKEDPYTTLASGQELVADQKPKGKPWGKIIGAILIVLLIIMAVSNPSSDDHKQAIRKQITEAIDKNLGMDNDEQGGFFTQMMGGMARMVALSVLNQGLDSMLEYHNYIICSKTTFHLDNKSYMSSFGMFGHVFTADEEQFTQKIGEIVTVQKQENSETTPDGTATMTRSIETAVGDSVKSITTRMTKQIGSAVATKVGEEVKKQVEEQTDSATSSGIGQLIDEIVSMFK